MADVNTAIYQPLQAPQMNPLQVLQALALSNENKLFQQEYESRQALGNAYSSSLGPDGQLDYKKLNSLAPTVGFMAPQAVQGAIANSSAATDLNSKWLQIARSTTGALASKPGGPTDQDISAAKANLAAQGIPGGFIQNYFAEMPLDAKGRKVWAVTQNNLARGPETVGGKALGPIGPGGNRPETSEGEAAYYRAGATPPGASAPAPSAPATPVVPPAPGMQVELPRGAATVMDVGGAIKANALKTASTYGADIFPMEQLLTNLEKLGPNKVGPGTQELNTLKSFINSNLSWLPGADKIIGNPEDIANYDKATKYATQLAGSRASMFGHGTDQAMATSLVGSPNTHISQLGSVDLTKAMIGLKRMEQTQALEGANVPADQYPTWGAKWATTIDPRAFMIDKMDKQQLANVEKTLKTPEQRRRFNVSVQRAIKAGVMELPQ